MCNKLSYYVSHSSTCFLQAKTKIESLTMKMEKFCDINLKGKNLAIDGGTSP